MASVNTSTAAKNFPLAYSELPCSLSRSTVVAMAQGRGTGRVRFAELDVPCRVRFAVPRPISVLRCYGRQRATCVQLSAAASRREPAAAMKEPETAFVLLNDCAEGTYQDVPLALGQHAWWRRHEKLAVICASSAIIMCTCARGRS